MDLTGERHRALLRGADLAGWRPRHEAPATLGFAGLTVCKTGPWGQGPVFLQQLALLDELGVASAAPGSADFIHLVVECAKLAFADREAWYGDPRFADVPLGALLSRAYAVQRSALVGAEASADLRPGRPGGAEPRLPGYAAGPARRPDGISGAEPSSEESGPTARPGWDAPGPAWAASRPPPAIPATWTWPTGSATWWRPRPAGAGCRARRSSPASASAWARGARCSP